MKTLIIYYEANEEIQKNYTYIIFWRSAHGMLRIYFTVSEVRGNLARRILVVVTVATCALRFSPLLCFRNAYFSSLLWAIWTHENHWGEVGWIRCMYETYKFHILNCHNHIEWAVWGWALSRCNKTVEVRSPCRLLLITGWSWFTDMTARCRRQCSWNPDNLFQTSLKYFKQVLFQTSFTLFTAVMFCKYFCKFTNYFDSCFCG